MLNPEWNNRGYPVSQDSRNNRIYLKRYFAEVFSSSPIARINNKGVEYALKGKLTEAKILFEEAIKEDIDFAPAYNNLGIVYELFFQVEDAFRMYSKACIIDADNEYYRRNFLYSHDNKNSR